MSVVKVHCLVASFLLAALSIHPTTARAAAATSARGKTVDFNRDIQPILSDNCYACHGPDEKKRKAKLRLDTRDGLTRDLGGYSAVKPFDLKSSALWKRITTTDPDDHMPPADSGKSLKPAQIALLKQWIEQGAKWQSHWSLETPVRPTEPRVRESAWVRNGVDRFIAAKLEEKGLKPLPQASRETLVRRVTLDLTGLPPTIAEVDAFLADTREDAYERLVDRLFDSPRYGEHMARYWLDAARYGDTHGLHLDNERSMWPYRDWVVGAFNRNLRFDQFTVEQLAGDLLPNPSRDQLIASGFNRCNVSTSEGGSINEEYVFRYAVDRTETMSAVWMGLTAGCAVCHDHKFDPISQKEFYQLFAFFHNAADPPMDGNILLTPPVLKLATPAQEKKLKDFDSAIGSIESRMKAELAKIEYIDPAKLDPPPPIKHTEVTWLDDDLPAGAKATVNEGNHPLKWVTGADGRVFSGKRAIKRTDKGLAQDIFEGLEKPFVVPAGGKFFVHVYLEADALPKAVMVQFNTAGAWSHRAVWGDVDAIDYGKKGTGERMSIGALPAAGEWVTLEFPFSKLGLKVGTTIGGLALTQFGGTVYWDKAGISADVNPVKDPSESQLAWEAASQGKVVKEHPKEIQYIFRSVNPKERTPEHEKQLRAYYIENIHAGSRPVAEPFKKEAAALKTKRDELDKEIPATLIMKDLEKPRDTFIMIRGQYNKPGEKVSPNVPAALPPLARGESPTRLDLARWLVDPKHPLTARVAVNRFWQQFFGVGIVKTAGDFGAKGERPTHPELLDWLATTFVQSGWDMRALVRTIVTSSTYRQQSVATPKVLAVDPENRFYAHGPRFRLDAEVIRDNALFVSGLLNPVIGGKGVKPYQPENIWEPVAYSGSNTRVYKQDGGEALYRRSLYTFYKRTAPPPSMTTLDAPSRESFCVRRERSDTPLQALLLMNDVQHFEAARAFAQRIISDGGSTAEQRLAYGFRLATARQPAKQEQAILKATLDRQLASYLANPEAAKKAVTVGESKPREGIDPVELAAYTLVANMLLNLDETLNKN
jgi:hypothetical protein